MSENNLRFSRYEFRNLNEFQGYLNLYPEILQKNLYMIIIFLSFKQINIRF